MSSSGHEGPGRGGSFAGVGVVEGESEEIFGAGFAGLLCCCFAVLVDLLSD